VTAIAVSLAAIVVAVGCGSDQPRTAASNPSACKPPLDARATLEKLRAQSNQVLDCGTDSFKRQIAALKGYPVVVNKWASWCGPCRLEFPFFARLARMRSGEIAFLGVDADDAKEDARKFLDDFPVPYPSHFDPDSKIAAVFRGQRVFPTTAFYDSKGELAFTKQGGYNSVAALADDIERYAR
jgi:cytochrome c biogenesis protein CcmG, thiol:disulfide interchange protein DsbE